MNNYIIKTNGLTKIFGEVPVVDHINLMVPIGQIYGFLGPNGAGKTTSIRMLLGLIRPTSGIVNMFGHAIRQNDMDAARRIGSLVESPSFYPHLTGWENLELVRRLRMLPLKSIKTVLSIVGLEKDSTRVVKHYSSGMCQRLGLAIALLANPELIILDEPTNGLDPSGIHEIRELLRSLPKDHGITVFLSSHLLSEVEQMATCIGIIQKGNLIFQGTPDELRSSYKNELIIRVDCPEKAMDILCAIGLHPNLSNGNALTVPITNTDEGADISRHLTNAEIRVFELNHIRPSLEEIFLQTTAINGIQSFVDNGEKYDQATI